MFDFSIVTGWLHNFLLSFMPGWLTTTVECVLIGVALLLVYALLALFYIIYERKLCAWFQCRLGPMRVGPWGALQVFADMFKNLFGHKKRRSNHYGWCIDNDWLMLFRTFDLRYCVAH